MSMLPEEKARVKIDKQLRNAGWDIVARNEYLPNSTSAVKEALMGGNTESDYLLFIDGKAIAVVRQKEKRILLVMKSRSRQRTMLFLHRTGMAYGLRSLFR